MKNFKARITLGVIAVAASGGAMYVLAAPFHISS